MTDAYPRLRGVVAHSPVPERITRRRASRRPANMYARKRFPNVMNHSADLQAGVMTRFWRP